MSCTGALVFAECLSRLYTGLLGDHARVAGLLPASADTDSPQPRSDSRSRRHYFQSSADKSRALRQDDRLRRVPPGSGGRRAGAKRRLCLWKPIVRDRGRRFESGSTRQISTCRLHHFDRVGSTFTRPKGEIGMASISERENREIEAANASGNTPVVFIHGLWVLPSSWANWADFFSQAGYAPLTPDWPGDPETVDEARANPEVFAKKTLKQVADHTTEIINTLDKKPAVMGHSTGGLVA